MSQKGMKNIYLCQNCGRGHVSIDIDEGTTPYITPCLSCKGEAVSMFYAAPQEVLADIPAAQEWYRPSILEIGTLPGPVMAHVKAGGLLPRHRPAAAKPSQSAVQALKSVQVLK